MLHTKSQGHWPNESREEDIQRVFTIYGCGGHLSICDQNYSHKFWLTNHKESSYEILSSIGPVVSEKTMF